MEKELKYNVDLCLTQYGNYCVYVNNYRVIGQSHQGIMKTIDSGTFTLEKIDYITQNKLKAFEFIKPYINVYAPNRSVDRDNYMLCVGHDAYEISKEIYELFKEVLL